MYNEQHESLYKTAIDNERFEEQVVNGQIGYYDKVEKVFIPERVFITLLEEIRPETDAYLFDILKDAALQRSRQRVMLNLQQTQYTGKDSYSQIFLAYLSRRFLLGNKNSRENMAILYIDLVGSTALSAIMSSDQLSLLVRIFCQEMSIIISKCNGYVLKYAGDAVIGYFPKEIDIQKACKNAIKCAFNMRQMIEESINRILFQNSYPKLKTRIAVDAGENQIVVLGSDPDLLGHVISRAAKIMGKAKPNQIVIGDNVFKNIEQNLKQRFHGAEMYRLIETGEKYSVYVSTE